MFYQTSFHVCSEKEVLKEKRRKRQELFQEQKVGFLRLIRNVRDLIRYLVKCGEIEGFCCVHIRGDGYFTTCPFGFVV